MLVLSLFYFDRLAYLMITLVGVIGIVIAMFSKTYMQGDRRYSIFFGQFFALLVAVMAMVSANHLGVFALFWGISNFVLSALMQHKKEWKTARASRNVALKTFSVGFVCILVSFYLLYTLTGSVYISEIIQHSFPFNGMGISALGLLIIGAVTQSALWPFNRWLLSSLNSPTPVSALMHAGLVNGGGFLLARFAPLFLQQPYFLYAIFIVGFISALLGSALKLIQHDIKRKLACSTLGQMGFMFMQCGLGFFPAAVAHLCWHGFFKAYLFLSSGGILEEKRYALQDRPSIRNFVLAVISGLVGSYFFAWQCNKVWFAYDSSAIFVFVAALVSTHIAIVLLQNKPVIRFPFVLIVTSGFCFLYGISVGALETVLHPLVIEQAQPLHIVYLIGTALLALFWVGLLLFGKWLSAIHEKNQFLLKSYVALLNAGQPDSKTITANRNAYRYK